MKNTQVVLKEPVALGSPEHHSQADHQPEPPEPEPEGGTEEGQEPGAADAAAGEQQQRDDALAHEQQQAEQEEEEDQEQQEEEGQQPREVAVAASELRAISRASADWLHTASSLLGPRAGSTGRRAGSASRRGAAVQAQEVRTWVAQAESLV